RNYRQERIDVVGVRNVVDQGVAGDQDQKGCPDADQSGAQADDEGLRVEHLGDVLLGGSNGPQDADLFLAFQNADVGDDADHDGGYDQGNGHKGDQHIADDVDDVCDRGHHGAHQIGIGDHLLVFSFFFHPAVIVIQDGYHLFLALEIQRIDVNGRWLGKIHIAKGGQ